MFFFDLATGALVGQPVAGQWPLTALAGDRFVITESYVGADLPFAWFIYDPMTGDRTRIGGCDLDLETGLCPDGQMPPYYYWVSSNDRSELLRAEFGRFTLVDPLDGTPVEELITATQFRFIGGFSDRYVGGTDERPLVTEDRETGEELATIEQGDNAYRFEQSPGSELLVFFKIDTVSVVDNVTFDIWDFPIELGRVQGIAIDAELRRIALGDENGLHVFDIDTGEMLSSIPIPGVADLHWISEDRLLVGTQTGAWATVSLLSEGLISSARAGVTRGFTAGECATYRIDPCPTLAEIQAR